MITRLLLAVLFFFVAASGSVANDMAPGDTIVRGHSTPLPMLRPAVTVRADIVTLGDLFDFAGSHAETPVFRAPEPGTRGRVETAAIVAAARSAGLEHIDLAGLRTVTVERLGSRLSAGDIEDLVAGALDAYRADRHGAGAGHYAISLAAPVAPLTVPAEQASALTVDLVAPPAPRSGAFLALVRGPRGEELARVEGRADHRARVPVLTRAVGRGEVIRSSDLGTIEIAYGRLTGMPTLTADADIIGMAAQRSLRAGAPLNPADLMLPHMVQRQELVTLIYRQGALALTVRARALDDGAEGQAVDVMNLQSNRVVRGIVTGRGIVQVVGPLDQLATLNPETLQ